MFVNHPGSVTHHDIVAACVKLRQAGFSPVPHVAARRLASFTQARDFMQRAAGEAGVTGILADCRRSRPRDRPVWRQSRSVIDRLGGASRHCADCLSPAIPRAIRVSIAIASIRLCAPRSRWHDSAVSMCRLSPSSALRRSRSAHWIASLREEGIAARSGSASPARPRSRPLPNSRCAAASARHCARSAAAKPRSPAS